jgi:predicted nucleic acid-binding protein
MSSSWVCVDANLVVRLVGAPDDRVVRELWIEWDSQRRPLAAPTLLFYEVSNALHRYQTQGLLSAAAVQLAVEAALALPVQLFGEADLHRRALKLAQRLSLPAAYDAHYLALAEQLDTEFWTADRRLVEAVQARLPWVQLVA